MEVVWEMDQMLVILMYLCKVRFTQLTTRQKEDTRTIKRLNLHLDVWYVPRIYLVTRTIDILGIFKDWYYHSFILSNFELLTLFLFILDLCILKWLESAVRMLLIFFILPLFSCVSTHSIFKLFVKFNHSFLLNTFILPQICFW